MTKAPRFLDDGTPDGRGRSEGSKATQFGAGDGRKRPGRPKGSKSLKSIYQKAGEMRVEVTIKDRMKKVSTAELLVLQQRDRALKGNEKAADRFLDRIERYEPVEVEVNRTGELLEEDRLILESARARGLIAPSSIVGIPSDDSTDEING